MGPAAMGYSKASKRRAKRGRPRIEGRERTETGRLSRSNEAQKSEQLLAIEAATWKRRQIDASLSIEEARKPEHGSVIMRWLEDWKAIQKKRPEISHPNHFTQMHYDTAVRYHELHDAYLGVIAARRQRSSTDFGSSGGYDGRDPFAKDQERHNASIEAGYKAARRAILESGALGMMAIEAIVLENRPLDHLRPDLRCALNRLAVLWKLQAAA